MTHQGNRMASRSSGASVGLFGHASYTAARAGAFVAPEVEEADPGPRPGAPAMVAELFEGLATRGASSAVRPKTASSGRSARAGGSSSSRASASVRRSPARSRLVHRFGQDRLAARELARSKSAPPSETSSPAGRRSLSGSRATARSNRLTAAGTIAAVVRSPPGRSELQCGSASKGEIGLAELCSVPVRLLEVVAEDLLVLAQVASGLLLEPIREPPVQVGPLRLRATTRRPCRG